MQIEKIEKQIEELRKKKAKIKQKNEQKMKIMRASAFQIIGEKFYQFCRENPTAKEVLKVLVSRMSEKEKNTIGTLQKNV